MASLKENAIELYKEVVEFVNLVLSDFPEEKFDEKIGNGETPREIIFHMIATPHFWMKKANRGFDFRAKFENRNDIKNLLSKQQEVFTSLLENDAEIKWKPPTSIPWIMIRSANHMMHHCAMLIYMRHIWGLSNLENSNWAKIMDLTATMNYSQ